MYIEYNKMWSKSARIWAKFSVYGELKNRPEWAKFHIYDLLTKFPEYAAIDNIMQICYVLQNWDYVLLYEMPNYSYISNYNIW